MNARARLGPIKVTLDEDAEPGLYQALAAVPVKSRSRRLVALAHLGAVVERQGMTLGSKAPAPVAEPVAIVANAADGGGGPAEIGAATSDRHRDAADALGAGLDDFLSNLAGPLAA